MKYLHSLQPPVIHSDLKTENILISDSLEAKASDCYSGKVFVSTVEDYVIVYIYTGRFHRRGKIRPGSDYR